uniref:Uncharacterized protein n=1 Tax=Triticum urartu TaxID=4572 RepID=A0A8R7TYZ7_TRIUA
MFHQLSLLNVSKQASAAASRRRTAAAARGSEAARGDGRFSREEELELELDLLSLPAVGGKQKMDAAGTSKRGRRPPTKPQKLKFKPKVPSRKPKKPPAQKPQLEETKPIDEELMKTLRTGRGDAKTLRVIKDEQSAQNSDSKTLSSAAGVSFQAAQSGKHKQPKNSQALQIPRAFPANPERFYGDEDDEDEDDDNVVREDDNDVELPESLPSSTECESSIHPAKELNLLVGFSEPYTNYLDTVRHLYNSFTNLGRQEHEDKTRMFLFQLPKSLPLLRTP